MNELIIHYNNYLLYILLYCLLWYFIVLYCIVSIVLHFIVLYCFLKLFRSLLTSFSETSVSERETGRTLHLSIKEKSMLCLNCNRKHQHNTTNVIKGRIDRPSHLMWILSNLFYQPFKFFRSSLFSTGLNSALFIHDHLKKPTQLFR